MNNFLKHYRKWLIGIVLTIGVLSAIRTINTQDNVISGTDRSRVLTYIIDKAEGTVYRDSVNIGEDFGNSNNLLTEGFCRMSDPAEKSAS